MREADIYSRQILDLAASVPRTGRLEDPDATVTARSRICGSRVTVDIKLTDGVVTEYAQTIRACAVGRAVASVVGSLIVGLSGAEIRTGQSALRAIFSQKRLPSDPPWTALEPFMPIADVRSRQGSAMLVFGAVTRAIEEAEGRETGQPTAVVRFDQDPRA